MSESPVGLLTLTGPVIVCGGEAHVTLTPVTSGEIQTLTILTQARVKGTLIHICNKARSQSTYEHNVHKCSSQVD